MDNYREKIIRIVERELKRNGRVSTKTRRIWQRGVHFGLHHG